MPNFFDKIFSNKTSSRRIILGLGSNLGDREFYLNSAIAKINDQLELKNLKKSQFFANKALLKNDSPPEWNLDFLNLAISADIDLEKFPPIKILAIIKSIEQEIGRKNNHQKIWAPREIDIDILAIDNLIVDLQEKLQIPHRSLLERDFFLKTMSQIEPNWQYPILGENFGKKITDFI